MELVKRNYRWPWMKRDIKRYVKNCHICRRAKVPRHRYQGLMRPLPIPNRPWKDIAIDFVVGLCKTEYIERIQEVESGKGNVDYLGGKRPIYAI